MTNLLKIPYSILRPWYEKTGVHQGVISEIQDERLAAAYSHCRNITRRYAKTFYMAARFLPYRKQRGIFAIYGLCRYLDHLVDEAEDLINQKKISLSSVSEKLEEFKEKLIQTYDGFEHKDPILVAFADMLKQHHIKLELPLQLLSGIHMDQKKNRFTTFEELYEYSYKVAGVVGLMTIEVFGYKNPSAPEHAVDLGIAMQLTNILRDVGEDLKKGRVYLPQNELKEFGIQEEEMYQQKISENFIRLMKFHIQRAREYYLSADTGITMLDNDSRLTVALARENYSRILNKIEQNGYDVFNKRAYLNTREKFSSLPAVAFRLTTLS